MEKKFYRSKTDKKLCGVCGGLAEYLNMDVNILRVLWVLVTLFAGAGLLAYIIIALIVPEKPDAAPVATIEKTETTETAETTENSEKAE